MYVATPFIEPDGGQMNITAKIIATLWYMCLVPDTKERLSRQIRRKRVPWYAPSRLFGIFVSAANLVTMPASWALLIAGKRNAARLTSLGVLANPPSITISLLLVNELSTWLLKKSGGIVASTGSLLAKPFTWINSINSNSDPAGAQATPAEPNTTSENNETVNETTKDDQSTENKTPADDGNVSTEN